MKFIKLIFTCSIICILISCNNDTDKTPDASENKKDSANTNPQPTGSLLFDKLVGLWQNEEDKSFERWTKNNDGTFTAAAFKVKGTDTSWTEQIRIYPEGSNWIYEPTVKDQNAGKAVKFTSSQLSDNNVQFSNPAHDFPTDINYTIANANTVNAFIVGPNAKGGKDTIPFNFTRIQ
jgi:hypothetical protein